MPEIPAEVGDGRVGRLLWLDRAGPRFRPGRHANPCRRDRKLPIFARQKNRYTTPSESRGNGRTIRNRFQQTLAPLAKLARGLIHCFSTGRGLAERALELGLYISISGIATFKAAEELRDIVRDVPLERLLVETDAPYLAPVPKRGKRNEPAFVVHTAERVAEVKGISAEALAAATTANFFALFTKARPKAAPCG